MTAIQPDTQGGLASFLPPVRAWFEETFGQPTPPQAQGWPAIQRGEHTLILAPTGSGKTLAAFLWGIDRIFRSLLDGTPKDDKAGVRLLYVSPLKALNNDIYRNLRVPLAGIRAQAAQMGHDYPPVRVSVRSGDTPQRERRSMLRTPPHILITTPESLYLMLTSPLAREIFRTVRTVIVDEIHTVAGNKRGVHLSLSLERLVHLANHPVQRIGLSATIQPLDEVAHFMGGNEPAPLTAPALPSAEPTSAPEAETGAPARPLQPRPVTVVNAAYDKAVDLRVVSVVDSFQDLPGGSIWPALIPEVLDMVEAHQTTLIFANSRRQAERAADRLNIEREARAAGQHSGLIEGGVAKGVGMMAAGTGGKDSANTPTLSPVPAPIRVHHGSVSKERRLDLERQLKAGELPALVGTSSLELGIDIGAVDLVVQLQSPKSVAQGLQRVGRSGHLVGQTSVGRIFPTHREDVIESAAIAGGMLRGEVEPTYTPRQPLDVLAQQIVAMVSVEDWDVEALYSLVRGAYAYEQLSWRVYTTTLDMLAGRYPTHEIPALRDRRLAHMPSQIYRELRPRLSWDRVNNKLAALPGSRWLALTNGGTIPDSGSFGAYLSDGKTKLGELDEEFVFETRIGDTLMLGSQVWRVIDMNDNRITVAEAPGAMARMPFWRGDYPWRPYELGQRVGAYRRAVAERLEAVRRELGLAHYTELREQREHPAVQALLDWLDREYALDARSAWHTLDYLAGQLEHTGAISSDRTILIEVFEDAIGDPRLVIHSPYGGRVNGPWGLALTSALRERTGLEAEVQTNDDGILFRLLDSEAELPIDVVAEMTAQEARERILKELPTSAVFGVRFRQNAARALLLPGARGRKRTPLWLQRLRAKDLLYVVRHLGDFPIVAETYRDCLQDVLDLPHLEEVLTGIHEGRIQVQVVESRTPSPVAQSLLYDLINVYMYEHDTPKAERQLQELAVSRDLLQELLQDVALDELLKPEAIQEVQGQLQHTLPTSQARSAEELAVHLQQMGDLSSAEIAARCTVDAGEWIARLHDEGRLVALEIPTSSGPERRWVAAEYVPQYRAAFGDEPDPEAQRGILSRYLGQTGPVTLEAIQARYALPIDWLEAELDHLIERRQLVHGRFTPREGTGVAEYVDRRTLERIHRRTLSILRREVQPVPLSTYAEFLARWQHLGPGTRLRGEGALTRIMQQLRALPVVGQAWERDVLPLRLDLYRPSELDALCQGGELVWVGTGGVDPRRGRVCFLFRGEGHVYLEPPPETIELEAPAQAVYDMLRSEGAAFFGDLCAATDLGAEQVETALIELVMAGLVTNDSPEALRQIVQHGSPRPPAPRPLSSLEEQLARRRQRLGTHARPLGQRPGPAQYRAAKRRVRQRLEGRTLSGVPVAGPAPGGPESRWVGRWTLVHRFGVMGKALPDGERTARQARQLLARWGIVTRESLESETGAWSWALIYRQLVRMEMRGEVRRGYFCRGLSGAQFALPEAVEQLRALRDRAQVDPELVVMNAVDPANLYGPQREGAAQEEVLTASGEPLTFSRVPSTWLVQQAGRPVLVAADSGARITLTEGVDEGLARRALQTWMDHMSTFTARVSVETWNEEPVLGSTGQPVLESVGFYRSYPAMTWDRR